MRLVEIHEYRFVTPGYADEHGDAVVVDDPAVIEEFAAMLEGFAADHSAGKHPDRCRCYDQTRTPERSQLVKISIPIGPSGT